MRPSMPRVVDCLSGETVYREESRYLCEIDQKRRGGEEKNYFLFDDEKDFTKYKESVSIKPREETRPVKKESIGGLFD